MNDFRALGLAEPVLRAIEAAGYTTPTPIQAQSIPALLEARDLLGLAQTGTGKTAAFTLPLLDSLATDRYRVTPGTCRFLILAPTRELAAQIADSVVTYGKFLKPSVAVVVGGVSFGPQTQALRRGVEFLVATPGRLLDHMGQRTVRLDEVEAVVLDEADHMMDIGFLPAIRRVVERLPDDRQTLLFSATMPKEIRGLAEDLLTDPVQVSVAPTSTTAERVTQEVLLVEAARKRNVLTELLARPEFARTLVFTRTKHGADRVVRNLEADGVPAAAIHGNKSQSQRERALAGFKSGQVRVLVATDIAARGIDVDNVTHVINYELPNVPETYVHRIGRTARAGASGMAISLCDDAERSLLKDIEKTTRQRIPTTDRRAGGGGARPAPQRTPEGAGAPPRPQGTRPEGAREERAEGGRPGGFRNRPRRRRSGGGFRAA